MNAMVFNVKEARPDGGQIDGGLVLFMWFFFTERECSAIGAFFEARQRGKKELFSSFGERFPLWLGPQMAAKKRPRPGAGKKGE